MNNRYREEENLEKEKEDKDPKEETPVEEVVEEVNDEVDDDEVVVEVESKSKKVKKLNEEIKKLKEENTDWKNKYLRVLAESENFKKRIDDERIRERKYASQRLLEKLVETTDIFDKACNMKTEDPMLKNFLIGFQMINNNIQNILSDEGVKKIKIEKMFDPRYHHAMETDYDETKEDGEILAVLKEGYMYKDRVLVPALVKVNKKPNNIEEDKAEEVKTDSDVNPNKNEEN